MKIILLIAIFLPLPLYATLNMEPGEWKVTIERSMNGKKFNPMASVLEKLEKMPADQRKKMESYVNSLKASQAEMNAPKILCHTKEDIKNMAFKNNPDNGCKVKMNEDSATKLSAKYTCKNGSVGNMVIEVKNPKEYVMTLESVKAGKTFQMISKGKWVKSECVKKK
jgi:hypothetical protein